MIDTEQHLSDFSARMDHRVRRAQRRLSVVGVKFRLAHGRLDSSSLSDLAASFNWASQAAERLSNGLRDMWCEK